MTEIRETHQTPKEEFNNMPEDNTAIYEFIDGAICMSPRPNFIHQIIMDNVHGELYHYFKGKPCKALTEVELEINEDVIIPDISVFCNMENIDVQRSKEPPVLVIEILSPSNTVMEMEDKREKYKNHGIKEMWLVNPKLKTVIQYNLLNETSITYTKNATFKSIVFEDLEIDLKTIFE